MDIRALFHNITNSINTTKNGFNAAKRLGWLYNISLRFSTQIKFAFPLPIGKINLEVRCNKGADAFIMSEVFEHQCYRLLLDNVTHIIDLGANAGFTAVYFSRFFPKATIVCIEPMPSNLFILKKNLALNKVNSVVFEAAVTIKDEQILMEVGDKDYANKVHDIPFGRNLNSSTLMVNGLSMNTIFEKLNWNKVDLLKIDIEGYEGVLLTQNNNWLAKIETIIMEIHEGVTIDTIKDAIAPYGFAYSISKKGNWILSRKPII
jgi:FkbM family methyltransferase